MPKALARRLTLSPPPQEPEPAPYLQGHYAAAVTARRSLVTPELPPEPTPKAWPLKKEERYTCGPWLIM